MNPYTGVLADIPRQITARMQQQIAAMSEDEYNRATGTLTGKRRAFYCLVVRSTGINGDVRACNALHAALVAQLRRAAHV